MADRTRRCEIRFTESEYHNLMAKAEKAGISVSALIRKSVDDCEVKAAPPADLHKLIWEIRRVGNNIDQILMIANARGLLDVPQLRKAMADLRETEKLIADTYSVVPVPRRKKSQKS